ncbi:MAG: UvrD-helicase domain-containing protein [Candidatus Omnitrophota bacterium]
MSRISSEKKFTKDQRAAIGRFGKNVCVKAGAGSGKTTILVERFLHAITERGAAPENILAITFTDKAANEMKTRLVAACRVRGLDELRRKLENAVISTIHSFCAKILRENPIEAGVDPYFRVLGEGEADILAEKILDGIFEDLSGNERWIALLADHGEETLRQAFRKFYDLSRAVGGDESLFGFDCDGSAIDQARTRITRKAGEILKREDKTASKTLPQLKEWAARVPEWSKKAESGGWEAVRLYRDLWEASPGKRGAAREELLEMKVLFGEWLSLEAERLAVPSKREFAACYRCFHEVYDAEKKRLAAYDFEDLLVLTWKLLSGTSPEKKAVRQRLADSFSAILVDEFQDTSALQVKIIDLLRRPGNFFVVGDAQQSIYSFRHAAPGVFEAIGTAGRDGEFEQIVLSDNYRAREGILRFVNGVFEGIFPENHFQPLVPRKTFAAPVRSPVEMLCVAREGDEKKLDRARVEEAARLARRLRELIDSGLEVEDEEGKRRPVRFGDIAVLFRKTDPLRFYEKAFLEAAIPYYVVKGRGFYEKQEILDLLNFLRLLGDPRQDIPLAGVLRSPLVRVSDDALLWLARAAKKNEDKEVPLWKAFEALGAIRELDPKDREKLEGFRDFLGAIRGRKNRLSVSGILRELLARTHTEAKLLTRPGGKQMFANVRKLLDLAHALEEKGVSSAEDFISFVKNLSEAEAAEAEAAVQSEESDSVKFFTIHKAKGLEFSCVVVADMGGKLEQPLRDVFLADPDRGLGMKLKDPRVPGLIEDAPFRAIAAKRRAAAAEEEDRILYVAMTRAKELLILSGALRPPRRHGRENTGSWMEKVASQVFPGGGPPSAETFEFNGVPVRMVGPAAPEAPLPAEKPSPAEDPAVREALLGDVPLKDTDLKRLGWRPDPRAYAALKAALEPVERSYAETLDLTVTDLLLQSVKDTEKKRAIAEEALLPEETEGEERTPRNEYGQIFHRIAEVLVSTRPAKFVLLPFMKTWMRPLNGKERREMLESLGLFWRGPWGEAIRRSKRAYAELPFIYKTRHGVLKGQIDLVFQTAHGEWVVLDYKTNRLAPSEKEELSRVYELQLSLYAFVFGMLYGEFPRKGVLYFAAIGEASERAWREKDFAGIEEKLERSFQRVLNSLDFSGAVL